MKEDKKPLLTVYTPTYNREKLLHRVYDSLKKQTSNNFKWLIIDDGSTDNTGDTVNTWQVDEKNFRIEYCYKENGGIHTARDKAFELCDTELIVGIDSDDWLLPNAVEIIEQLWYENENQDVIGIFASSMYEDGTSVCPPFPRDLKYATCQEFLYKYRLKSDNVNVFKSSMIKNVPNAPSFAGEKLIGEGYKFIQIPDDKPFIVKDIPLQVKEYQDSGYTVDAHEGIFKNPRGFREDYRQHIICSHYFKPKMRGMLGYIICSFLIKDKHYICDAPNPFLIAMYTPLGVIGYILICRRKKKSIKARIK